MQPTHLNFVAVVVATVVAMVVGMAWFSTPLFGGLWMRIVGVDASDTKKVDEMKKGMGPLMGLVLVGEFFAAYMLARFLGWLEQTTWVGGVRVAVYVWIGFLAPLLLQAAVFSGKPPALRWKMFAVQAGHSLVVFAAMGAILGAWR